MYHFLSCFDHSCILWELLENTRFSVFFLGFVFFSGKIVLFFFSFIFLSEMSRVEVHGNTLCWWPSPSESSTSKAILFLVKVNACAKFSFRDNKKAGRASISLKRRWKEPTLCKGDSFTSRGRIDLQSVGTRPGREIVARRLWRRCREAEVPGRCHWMRWYSAVICPFCG